MDGFLNSALGVGPSITDTVLFPSGVTDISLRIAKDDSWSRSTRLPFRNFEQLVEVQSDWSILITGRVAC